MFTSAIIATSILILLIVFQIALIAGAPLGHFAWGGKNKILPVKLRIASVSSILIYILFILFILSKAHIWEVITYAPLLQTGLWVMTGYLFLGVLLNLASRSKQERYTMTLVALVLAVTFLVVAIL